MYFDSYSDEIVKKLVKLNKKDSNHLSIVRKKINYIIKNPMHSYKFLHHNLKGFNRVHIGHFVLVFKIDYEEKKVIFEDYDHHDKIYL
ncbi:hypothetical protein HOK51_09400 [Candidatus Woesearchaeota archaeon]|jgi:YafQ family addiction module toxin component|nr:hypothetical protein [Candidatus Woesearchaeota archaeon]MBT6520044.1 hypothetical protein [Candidatus Woesearchaeota archaeon]MBT7368627.1 hypothetical protein [Candidatus Woesearchaeota archaeon]